MYIVCNHTERTVSRFKGNFPAEFIEEKLRGENKLIVISLYSNTIQIPYKKENLDEWEWKEFPFL